MQEEHSLEEKVFAVICRDLSRIRDLPKEAIRAFQNTEIREVLAVIRHVYESKGVLTLESIAAQQTRIALELLQEYDAACTPQQLMDWDANLQVLEDYLLRFRMMAYGQWVYRQAVAARPDTIHEVHADSMKNIRRIETLLTSEGLPTAYQVLEQIESRPDKEESHRQILTGIRMFDTITGGGVDLHQQCMIIGPAGEGKTTLARQMMHHMAKYSGEYVVHFAHDGGGKEMHAMIYWTMETQLRVNAEGLTSHVTIVDKETGETKLMPIITMHQLRSLIRRKEMFPVIPPDMQRIAFDVYRNLDGFMQNIIIGDATDILHSPERLIRLMDYEYKHRGAATFFLDYGNAVGDPKLDIFKRTEYTAKLLNDYVKEHDIRLFILNHVTRDSNRDNKETLMAPYMRGGDQYQIDSDWSIGVLRSGPQENADIWARIEKGRFGKSGLHIKAVFDTRYMESGLLVERYQ
jgi:energy-coupling factor transporter ATP-binding protein EcfA2